MEGAGRARVCAILLRIQAYSFKLPRTCTYTALTPPLPFPGNAITGAVPPGMLDWANFGSGRDDRCQLQSSEADCSLQPVPAPNNKFACPVPPGAAAHCSVSCAHKPPPVPTTCVSVADWALGSPPPPLLFFCRVCCWGGGWGYFRLCLMILRIAEQSLEKRER